MMINRYSITFLNKPSRHYQKGGSSLVIIMFLMSLSTFMLLSWYGGIRLMQIRESEEIAVFHQINLAESALSWGLNQPWPPVTSNWFCLNYRPNVKSCLKQSKSFKGLILTGESQSIKRYRLISQSESGKLVPHRNGWLDYCPEKKESDCDG